MKIKLLVVQFEAAAGDIDKNIEKVEKLLDNCGHACADLIVLPELWTTGWDCGSFNKHSEDLYSSKTYLFLKKIAQKFSSNVAGGSAILRRNGGKDRNTCIFLNRNGDILAIYDKYHLFSHRGQSEALYLQEGDAPVLVNTDIGKIGLSVCYDIRFPEMFRLYAFNGADLMINMAAWPKTYTDEYVTLAKARAVENQIYFVTSCLTGKINESFNFSGNSFVSDYKGRVIAKLGEEEAVLCAEINLEEMKQYRQQMNILKDTKPKYQLMENQ